MTKTIVLGGSNSHSLARKIANKLKAKYGVLITDRFPDGELYLRLPFSVKGKKVILIESMHPNPDRILIETIFASRTCKELGAKEVVLVAPYLAYLRQDKRFHPRECWSNRIMAALVTCADKMVVVDPHIQRIKNLHEIFNMPAKKISANSVLGDYIKKNVKNPLILGPDWESFQWAEKIAEKIKVESTVLRKKRYTSRSVRIKLKGDIAIKGRNVVIIDDIISSGHTMIEVVKQAKKKKAKSITCLAVHGIFSERAYSKIKKAGATKIITTNTIENKTSKLDVSGVITKSLT
ncbi:ribose-phosphate diphosphokinase [Candidatus Woesearchaeota archaeon]|nr:ribose-phosphate diphosphokinase [Candidatus Woesearchaeota archaeon]